VAADLMQEDSDRVGCGQPELMQDQLGIPLKAVVYSSTDIGFFVWRARMEFQRATSRKKYFLPNV